MADRYDLEKRRGYLKERGGFNAQNWQDLAELGVLALPFAEEDDGLGGDSADIMAVMEAFGVGPLVEPFVPSILLAGGLIAKAGNGVQKSAWLPKLMTGEAVMTLGFAELKGRYNLAYQAMTAEKTKAGFSLSGDKAMVQGDPSFDAVIIAARTSGEVIEKDGISLFLLPLNSKGLSIQSYRLVDGSPAMVLRLNNVHLSQDSLIGELGKGYEILEPVLARASLALCSEAIGLMDALMEETLSYMKTRQQFGRAIGSFQALQHRMAEHFVALEQAKSIVIRAIAADETDVRSWLREIYGAKAYVSEVAMKLGQDAIQFHGGMGTTDELIISHYHKRLLFIQTFFGDATVNYRRHHALAA